MLTNYKKCIVFFVLFVWVMQLQAQWKQLENPIEEAQKVGDYVIAHSSFRYQLQLKKELPGLSEMQSLNLENNFGKGIAGAAFAYTQLQSAVDTTVTLSISHSDASMIWLNGKPVYENVKSNKFTAIQQERNIQLQFECLLPLKKGNNDLLLKSVSNGNGWKIIMQAIGSDATIGLRTVPDILPDVAKISNWLIMGPFAINNLADGMQTKYGVEDGFKIGRMYSDKNQSFTWSIPRVELTNTVPDNEPYWGSFYHYNYHNAGLARAMALLSQQSGVNRYDEFSMRYCNFMLESLPFIRYQVDSLNQFYCMNHLLVNTPLLDFTAATAMPFVHQLRLKNSFENKPQFDSMFTAIKQYVIKEQVRLPLGNFTRLTPEKYTTWVDDMYMGIPFLMQCALETTDAKERSELFTDAARQVIAFNQVLFDAKDGLYHHARHSQRPEVNYPYWLRANGWGLWAATEVLQDLPAKHPLRKQVMAIYRKQVESLLKYQDSTGFWHNIINMPTTRLETSGTAIFTQCIARGITNGWLDKKRYLASAINGWKAVSSRIKNDGSIEGIIVGSMTSEDETYYENQPMVNNDSHGTFCVMMACLAMDDLMKKIK